MCFRRHPAWPLLAISALALSFSGCGGSDASRRVVVYCAHDREFAEDILKDFQQRTGLDVQIKWDTEANKSVSLFEDLVRESKAGRPRCDVHWNNEILATIRLQTQEVYQPYASPAAAGFAARDRATDHTWTAFAARARVILVNTDKVKEADWPRSLKDLLEPRFKDRAAIAKPQFGTTATHFACLLQAWGDVNAREFFARLKANDVHILAGNKHVAEAVGDGTVAVGLTDTDDAMAEIEAGRKVAMLFPEHDTLLIPNTVAIVKDCPNPAGARKLVDFLLSAEVEKKLAESKSRQIPLNPQVKADLPIVMRPALKVAPLKVDFAAAARDWQASQQTLVKIFNLR